MSNPFRDKTMRREYDSAVRAYRTRSSAVGAFFDKEGARRPPGSTFATFFWHGYDGVSPGRWDAASRKMVCYAYWRAGRDMARESAKGESEADVLRRRQEQEAVLSWGRARPRAPDGRAK